MTPLSEAWYLHMLLSKNLLSFCLGSNLFLDFLSIGETSDSNCHTLLYG